MTRSTSTRSRPGREERIDQRPHASELAGRGGHQLARLIQLAARRQRLEALADGTERLRPELLRAALERVRVDRETRPVAGSERGLHARHQLHGPLDELPEHVALEVLVAARRVA